jgi:hypothetical protein
MVVEVVEKVAGSQVSCPFVGAASLAQALTTLVLTVTRSEEP